MEDHFTKCVKNMEVIVRKNVDDEFTVDQLMLSLTKVVADYAITEIKDLNLRTNEILKKAMETGNEQRNN
jgi:hypothetical protein